jgi:TRAP-type C4-dicarboxylate transport system permease small subunit
MDLFLKIVAAAVMGMMVYYAWRAYQQWQEHGPKPQKGDWQAVALPLGLVVLVVILLIAVVR